VIAEGDLTQVKQDLGTFEDNYGLPHDIALGANGAPNTPGWDYVTGRGTPDISAFVANP
jgi:hypothetical protein